MCQYFADRPFIRGRTLGKFLVGYALDQALDVRDGGGLNLEWVFAGSHAANALLVFFDRFFGHRSLLRKFAPEASILTTGRRRRQERRSGSARGKESTWTVRGAA